MPGDCQQQGHTNGGMPHRGPCLATCGRETPLEWKEWENVCRLTPKSLNCGVREAPQRHLQLHNSLLEQVSVETHTGQQRN
jgi:hypothetical protein